MNAICYECYETGMITETETASAAQFSTVKKYDILYAEELPRFQKEPVHIYGLPFGERPEKIYSGTGRMGLDCADEPACTLTGAEQELVQRLCRDDSLAGRMMQQEASALQYLRLFHDAEKFELIWVRSSGAQDGIPAGYTFIGYDISYPCACDGSFSIICDCMFICRWHGCDEAGTLFASDFHKLNQNGLFDAWQDAYDYMVKYLNESWTERGEYYIYEIYKKSGT